MSKRGRDNGGDDEFQREKKIPKLSEGADTVEELLQLASDSENEFEPADYSEDDNVDDASVERIVADMLADPDGEASTDSNAPSWETLSEMTDSGRSQPEEPADEQVSETVDDDGEGNSPLRVPKEREEEGAGTLEPEPEPEPDSSSSNRPAKIPKTSDLKINPKNYPKTKSLENKPEPCTPQPHYTHSDEDSEDEGKPKREFSKEFDVQVKLRRPVAKKPPEKRQ